MANWGEECSDSDTDFSEPEFWFAKIWLCYIIGSISRFLLKSPGFETSTSSFMVPKGRGLQIRELTDEETPVIRLN